jgi:hypothetical protein
VTDSGDQNSVARASNAHISPFLISHDLAHLFSPIGDMLNRHGRTGLCRPELDSPLRARFGARRSTNWAMVLVPLTCFTIFAGAVGVVVAGAVPGSRLLGLDAAGLGARRKG